MHWPWHSVPLYGHFPTPNYSLPPLRLFPLSTRHRALGTRSRYRHNGSLEPAHNRCAFAETAVDEGGGWCRGPSQQRKRKHDDAPQCPHKLTCRRRVGHGKRSRDGGCIVGTKRTGDAVRCSMCGPVTGRWSALLCVPPSRPLIPHRRAALLFVDE